MVSEYKMSLERFMEIVETEEYEVEEIKPFLDFLFNCNYNELCDYLLGDYLAKLDSFMKTLFDTMNSEDDYYGLFFEMDLNDNDVLFLFHKSNYLLYKVVEICYNGRLAFVDYENDVVEECKNYFDVLNILDEFEIFSESNIYILDNVIYQIKNLELCDWWEYKSQKN